MTLKLTTIRKTIYNKKNNSVFQILIKFEKLTSFMQSLSIFYYVIFYSTTQKLQLMVSNPSLDGSWAFHEYHQVCKCLDFKSCLQLRAWSLCYINKSQISEFVLNNFPVILILTAEFIRSSSKMMRMFVSLGCSSYSYG